MREACTYFCNQERMWETNKCCVGKKKQKVNKAVRSRHSCDEHTCFIPINISRLIIIPFSFGGFDF